VLLFNGSLNVSTTTLFNPIPVAPFCGLTLTTVGGVVSVPAVVVKPLENPFTPLPAVSSNPLLNTDNVSELLAGSGALGVNVTTPVVAVLFTAYVPLINMLLLIFNGIFTTFTVVASIGALNVTATTLVSGTFAAPFTGVVLTWLGRTVRLVLPVLKLLLNVVTVFPATSSTPLTLTE